MEEEDVRHVEYMMLRATDALCMDRIKEQLVALQASSTSNGGLDSIGKSYENQLIGMLTGMTDKSQEIDASDSLDVEVSTTPYTIVEMVVLEALREAFLVVDAAILSHDRVIEPSISEFHVVPIIKGFLPFTVRPCSYSKHLGSSPMTVLEDFNIVIPLILLMILLSDPPDLVSIPPLSLALPWLHHSVYPIPLKSPSSSKVNNLPLYFQFEQKNYFGS
ncbi:unnamed protein product [Vicia faba]|uniref:Uncharacterized protein n=1 Tax=Vicia faba TaxID=3906 RepID=A0AAV1AVF7_VICFA|nr:unnamed protein product [Vicia faba]